MASLGGGAVQIKWQDKSNDEDGFAVQREKKTDTGWDERYIIANLSANITVTTDTPGQGVYRYHVLSRKSGAASAWSDWTEIKN